MTLAISLFDNFLFLSSYCVNGKLLLATTHLLIQVDVVMLLWSLDGGADVSFPQDFE